MNEASGGSICSLTLIVNVFVQECSYGDKNNVFCVDDESLAHLMYQ